MHEVPLLINITLALVVAFIGGTLARRIGLPTIVGYLIAGIAISPFTPGWVGDTETIQQLAELGVIFLMFGVGLHFSFQDLWRVRDIAVPGALLQTLLATLLGVGLTRLWGWSLPAGIVLGLAISVASTVVLLRGLMDNSLLNTAHGQAAVGWLVMEDILSVLILVLMPALASGPEGFAWSSLGLTLLKAAAFVVIMFFGGSRLLPWLLERIAHTRSRELFILAILAVTLGTAVGASELFDISLALGAFVAGAIISQSHLSHQVGADVFAFRESFAVLFFVSVGMLVNPSFLLQNIGQVLALTFVVVIAKSFFTLLLGLIFPRPARTFLVIALGLSQIGEFSFILGQGGMALGLLETNQYSLILAAALLSITVNPLMYRLLPWLERSLQQVPFLWKRLEKNKPIPEVDEEQLRDHVVLIGYGRVGSHLVDILENLAVPFLVIEEDYDRIEALNQRKANTLYGDAANSEVITHAHLDRARVLVVTVPEETSAELIVTAARDLNPELPIIARASTEQGVRQLAESGARYIIHPELEGGLEMIHHTLLCLGYPLREVHEYGAAVRRDHYDMTLTTDEEHRTLHQLIEATERIEIHWVTIHPGSPLEGISLHDADLRTRTGASVVAMLREGQMVANPKSQTIFQAGDRIGLIGDEEHLLSAQEYISAAPA